MSQLETQLARAQELIDLKRDAQALELLLRLLREHPDEAGTIEFHLARAHLVATRHAEAEAHARRAITQAPDHYGGYLLLGAALHLQGRTAEASLPLIDATRLEPEESAPHRLLAQVFCDLGDLRQAYAAATESLRLAPHAAESHFAMGYVLHDSNPAEAHRAYLSTLELDPEHTEAKHNLAGLSAVRGDWTNASHGMARVLAENPDAESPIFVLDQRLVGVIRWLHWLTAGTFMVAVPTLGGSAWLSLVVLLLALGGGVVLVRIGIAPIRAALPQGGTRYLRGFPGREFVAFMWLVMLALVWVLFLLGPILELATGTPFRFLAAAGLPLLFLGFLLSWLRVPMANQRADQVRRR